MEVGTAERTRSWRERLEAHPNLVVVGVIAVLAAPYLLSGPEIMADDWVWIRNGEFLGWWDAGGSRQAGRPGAFALYAVTFGLIGAHPLALYVAQVGLWMLAAVCVLRCLRAYIDPGVALAVTLLWLAVPSHSTLELWPSTCQGWMALVLLAEGLRIVRVSPERSWRGYLLLALSGCFYEVVMPVVPVGLAIDDRLRTGRFRWQPIALGAALIAPALAWSLLASTIYPDDLGGTEGQVVEHLGASLALGLPVQNPVSYGLVLVAAVVAYLSLRAVRRRGFTGDPALVLAGLAVVLGGTVFALRSYLLPDGIGNRVTVASGVGAALLWVGAYRWARRSFDAGLVAIVGTAVLVALALPVRAMYLADWIDTADEGAAEATRIGADVGADPDGYIVEPDAPAVGEWTYALLDGWQTTAAAQVINDDPTVVVAVAIAERCLLTGPPREDPLTQFGDYGPTALEPCPAATDSG